MAKQYQPYQGTNVTVSRSQAMIEKMLQEHGAVKIHFFKDFEKYMVVMAWERKFIIDDNPVVQPLAHHITFKDKKEMQVYRALYYHLKAKFEAVDFEIVSFEEEFLPYFVMKFPDGSSGTIAEYFIPDLKRGSLPPFKPLGNLELTSGNIDYEIMDD